MSGVARQPGIDHSLVKRWCRSDERWGLEALRPKVGKRVFSAEFKLAVLSVMEQQHLSLAEACLRFPLSSEALILTWQKRFKSKGAAGPHMQGTS